MRESVHKTLVAVKIQSPMSSPYLNHSLQYLFYKNIVSLWMWPILHMLQENDFIMKVGDND